MARSNEFEEEVIEVFVYDVDLAIEMLDKIKEVLIDLQDSTHTPAFVRITGYFNVDTVEFRFKVNTVHCNPKANIVKTNI